MRFLKFNINVINIHQIEIFIADDLENDKINNSFNSLHNFINSNYLVFLNYLLINDIHNKRINLNHVHKIYNIIIN